MEPRAYDPGNAVSLRFGALDGDACVVCVDMQRLFLEPGEWHCPGGLDIVPACVSLLESARGQRHFIRYLPPHRPQDAPGAWRTYHRRWSSVTLEQAGDSVVRLHPALESLAASDSEFDRMGYSAFASREFRERMTADPPSAAVVCGVETDVCVLSTILSFVDAGIRTVVPVEAVASASRAAHDAVLGHVLPRYDMQVELCSLEDAVSALEAA